ncbi:MAG: class I SAM-dependent methyltransferase, partial [Deltaproteobacteria bacterium]|nr:class I SAM-dependent methyltransferase [Deltaproteobacteria bacterium]
MARLASQAKMGYYPTPPGVVEHVKTGLVLPGPGLYRLLDTCCG